MMNQISTWEMVVSITISIHYQLLPFVTRTDHPNGGKPFSALKRSRIKPPKGSRTEEPFVEKWLFRVPSLPGWWFFTNPSEKICDRQNG